ncbi:hypothetical protein [Mycobacterium sp. URHB0021]
MVNQRRADLVLISEDPDRFVQGGIMLQLRWKKMMGGLLRWGCAAGVCVLAAGLLMCAGRAVAVADPSSSGTAAHGDHKTDASGQQPAAAKTPKDAPGGTDTKDAGSLDSGSQPDQQHSTARKKPKDEPGGTDTNDGTKDGSNRGATVSDPGDAVANEVAPVPGAVAPVSDPVDAVTDEVAPVPGAVAPVAEVVGPPSAVRTAVQEMLTSVAGAVVPLTQLQCDLYSFLLGIAQGASVSDIGALVHDMLSSVVGAVVVLAQLPSDLFSFLLGIAGVRPVVGGLVGSHDLRLSAAAGASVVSRLPMSLTPFWGRPLPVPRACRSLARRLALQRSMC